MSLTKEKCEDCVSIFTDKICLSCPNEYCTVKCEVSKSENQLYQLIEEYFELKEKYIDRENELLAEINSLSWELKEAYDNPPLKLEELKLGEWVWDNKYDMWNRILEIRINCAKEQEIEFDYSLDNDEEIYNDIFEENRFYRKQVMINEQSRTDEEVN